jgi:hypothetical protein
MTTVSSKIIKLADNLVSIASKSPLPHKHGAYVLDHKKPVGDGYNHDRMTNKGSVILSFHAEMSAVMSWLKLSGFSELLNFINDSPNGMYMKKECILKGSAVI